MKHIHLFLIFLAPSLYAKNILTIDIGGTRTKSAIIQNLDKKIEVLKHLDPIGSSHFLGGVEKLEKNLCLWIKSTIQESKYNIDIVSIGFPGPVSKEGNVTHWDISENVYKSKLKRRLTKCVGKPHSIVNDMISWILGSRHLLGFEEKKRTLFVALGTGFGLGLIDEKDEAIALQAFDIDVERFLRTRKDSIIPFNESRDIHKVYGHRLFEKYKELNIEGEERKLRFTRFFNKTLADLKDFYAVEGLKIEKVIIGGGFSWFLTREYLDVFDEVELLPSLVGDSNEFDLIPLKGLALYEEKSENT